MNVNPTLETRHVLVLSAGNENSCVQHRKMQRGICTFVSDKSTTYEELRDRQEGGQT